MKIMLKIYKSNASDCVLCLISAVLVSAMIFLFEGIRRMIRDSLDEYDRTHSNIGIASQTYIFVLLFVGIVLIMYTVSNYSRGRLKDYGMLMVFGAEKQRIMRIIFLEYGIYCGFSCAAGCVAGIPLLFLVRHVFGVQDIPAGITASLLMETTVKTFLYMLFVYAAAVLLNLLHVHNDSLSSLMNFNKKKNRIPSWRQSAAGVSAGTVCLVLAALLFSRPPASYRKMKWGVFLFLCGAYLLFTHLGNLCLMLFKKRERWYYRHLLKVKNLYYRFSDSKNLMLAVFLIQFFVLAFVNINIVEYSSTASRYLWKYPYDYVWVTDEKHTETVKKAISEWKNVTKVCPCVKVTSNDGGEYTAISASSYKQFSGHEVNLKPGTFLSVIEKSESDEDILFGNEQVYLMEGGKAKLFRRKEERNEILFVAQQPELIGIVVMEEQDFAAMRLAQGSSTVIVTQNMSIDVKEAGKRVNKTAQALDASVYSKESLMRQDRQQDVTTLVFYICLGVFFIICGMTALAVKVWAEIPLLSTKYSFLKKLGMDDREVKRNVKGELSAYMQVPFWLSVAAAGASSAYIMQDADAAIVKDVLVLFVFFAAVQALYTAGIRECGYRRVCGGLLRRETGNGID